MHVVINYMVAGITSGLKIRCAAGETTLRGSCAALPCPACPSSMNPPISLFIELRGCPAIDEEHRITGETKYRFLPSGKAVWQECSRLSVYL